MNKDEKRLYNAIEYFIKEVEKIKKRTIEDFSRTLSNRLDNLIKELKYKLPKNRSVDN